MAVVATYPSRHASTTRTDLNGDGQFVKIARTPVHRAELAREAEMYALLAKRIPGVSTLVPGGVNWDPIGGRLHLDTAPGRNLQQVVVDEGRLPPKLAAAAGKATAILHLEGRRLADGRPPPARTSCALHVQHPGPGDLRLLSGGGIDLLRVLQRSDALCRHLDRLTDESRADTLIHGDLRWENVMVEEWEGPTGVRIVDWEFAGWGEAAWDVGCFMGACLGAWLFTIPQVPGVPPDQLVNLAAVPLRSVRDGLVAFWTAYVERRQFDAGTLDEWVARCTELVAARLVHLAFEATADEEHVRATSVAHLQVALNVLENPAQAARDLLGIAR